jgi:hypothetical protein
MITRKQAFYALSQHYDLSLAIELEPRIEGLIDMAFECIAVGDEKRCILPDLAMYATRLVGSNAVCQELRMAKYEEALHNYLNWLVSESEEAS